MPVKNTLIKLLVAVAVTVPVAVSAQTSSINAFSPYTMYGIGEQNTPGTLPQRSMGGIGVATRSPGIVNLLNPASFSAAPQKSFLFSFGLEGQNTYNSQTMSGVEKHSAYNSFNFHDISFQMPVAKKLGLGFSLTPYSSVGYRVKYMQEYSADDPLWGYVGPVQYIYQGEGDVTEVKLGMGWEVFKHFSVGLSAQYYWGNIDRGYVATPTSITGEGNFGSVVGDDNYSISSFKGQAGLQWDVIYNTRRALTIGATYDFGGDLRPKYSNNTYIGDLYNTSAKSDTTQLKLVLPHQIAVGVLYQSPKWIVGADFVYQNWGSSNNGSVRTAVSGADQSSYSVAYTNTSTIKVGFEYTPNRYDVRHALKRWSYRAGFRYGNYNQTYNGQKLSQYAVTAGIGIPVKLFAVSSIDIGVEYGRRGYNVADRLGLVRQQYFKIGVGFSLFAGGVENQEYWFMRPKYD